MDSNARIGTKRSDIPYNGLSDANESWGMATVHDQIRASQNALSALNVQNRGIPGADAYLEEVLCGLEELGSLAENVAAAIRAFVEDDTLPGLAPDACRDVAIRNIAADFI